MFGLTILSMTNGCRVRQTILQIRKTILQTRQLFYKFAELFYKFANYPTNSHSYSTNSQIRKTILQIRIIRGCRVRQTILPIRHFHANSQNYSTPRDDLRVYIYIYIYTYVYIYIYRERERCICICICMYVYTYVYIYICTRYDLRSRKLVRTCVRESEHVVRLASITKRGIHIHIYIYIYGVQIETETLLSPSRPKRFTLARGRVQAAGPVISLDDKTIKLHTT